MFFGLQAQTEIKTYDACDANLDTQVNVGDAEHVANHVLAQKAGPNVVTAEQLNGVLQDIYQLLGNLSSEQEGIKQRLNYVMEKMEIGNPFDPDENGIITNGHEYVDLGVVVDDKPVYWATTNIGAESPADAGLFFAWGETVGYGATPQGDVDQYGDVEILDGRKFDWASYSSDLCGGDYNKMKKYCTSSSYGTVDNKTVLDPKDDAAHVNWQGTWRMPTTEEQDALRTQCTWIWTTMTNSAGKSVNGYKVSNKTDSSKFIFLPAAGYRYDGNLNSAGSDGDYWSSSLNTSGSRVACNLYFTSGIYIWRSGDRYCGRSVRPVCQ